MSLVSRIGAAVMAASTDNPVLEKDALSQLRLTRTQLQMLGLLGGTFVAAATLLIALVPDEGRSYGLFQPGGRELFAAVLGAALLVQTLGIPLVAASSIASERERGTLPLMTASALSPMQIVMGKLLGVLATQLPVFLPILALLPLGYAYGDVPLFVVVAGIVACAWHGFSMAAIGVSVSASADRLRVAAPQALALAVAVAVVGAVPLCVAAVLLTTNAAASHAVPFALFGVFVESTVAWLAIVNARSALAPRHMPRWRTRRPPVLALVVVAPLLAAVLGSLFSPGHDVPELVALLHFETALVMWAAVLIEVAVSDQSRVDGRTPARTALTLSALAAAALVLARLWPAPDALLERDESLFGLGWLSVFVVAGYLAFCATVVAAAARFVTRPAVRVAIAGVVLLGLFVGPLVLHEARHVFQLGLMNFLWLQPVAVIETIEKDREWTSPWLGVAFFALAPLALAVVARRPRRA